MGSFSHLQKNLGLGQKKRNTFCEGLGILGQKDKKHNTKCVAKRNTKTYNKRNKTRSKIVEFEWDEEKARINKIKHGISFEVAAFVFNDDHRIEYFDTKHSATENRYITIGLVEDVLVVVYTFRDPKYRIISARVATKKEREWYINGY